MKRSHQKFLARLGRCKVFSSVYHTNSVNVPNMYNYKTHLSRSRTSLVRFRSSRPGPCIMNTFPLARGAPCQEQRFAPGSGSSLGRCGRPAGGAGTWSRSVRGRQGMEAHLSQSVGRSRSQPAVRSSNSRSEDAAPAGRTIGPPSRSTNRAHRLCEAATERRAR